MRSIFNKTNTFALAAALVAVIVMASNVMAADSFKLCGKNSDAIFYLAVKSLRGYLDAAKAIGPLAPQIEKVKGLTSIDMSKDIDSFTAVLTNLSNVKAGKSPDGAFIFEGRFRVAEIESKLAAAGLKPESFDGAKLFKADEDVFLAVPNDRFAIYGNSAEVKRSVSLIAGKSKEDAASDEYYGTESALAEYKNGSFMFFVKIPADLAAIANVIAKANKDQAMFAGLKTVSFCASGEAMFFKYAYGSPAAAASALPAAQAFMDNGFGQIAANEKRLDEASIDKAKAAPERVNFVRSGMRLFLKLRDAMKISNAGNAVTINFDLKKAAPETLEFVSSAVGAFVAAMAGKDAPKAATPGAKPPAPQQGAGN